MCVFCCLFLFSIRLVISSKPGAPQDPGNVSPPVLKVYTRRQNRVVESKPIDSSALPTYPFLSDPDLGDSNLSLSIRKGKRICTSHHLSHCLSYDHLSPSSFSNFLAHLPADPSLL